MYDSSDDDIAIASAIFIILAKSQEIRKRRKHRRLRNQVVPSRPKRTGNTDDKNQNTRDSGYKKQGDISKSKTSTSKVGDVRNSKRVKSDLKETEGGFQFVSCETDIKEEYEEEEDSADFLCDRIENENERENEDEVISRNDSEAHKEGQSQINVAIKEEVDFDFMEADVVDENNSRDISPDRSIKSESCNS